MNFWVGFEKRALEAMKMRNPLKDNERQGWRPMGRSISDGSPRLDQVTIESDRAKFRTFKG